MLQVPDRSTKALLDFANYMEKVPARLYRQEVLQNLCGGGCIAYWACRWASFEEPHLDMAAAELGITDRVIAAKLFHADGGKTHSYLTLGLIRERGPTPKEAASALRTLAVTGELPSSWTKHIRDCDDHPTGDVLHDAQSHDVSYPGDGA